MATKTLMPVEDYLSSDFDGPTPEFLDGELVERGMPTFAHGNTAGRISYIFERRTVKPPLYAGVEVHVQVAAKQYRIFDVVVLEQRIAGIPGTPPLIDIEILSADERLDKIVDRFSELRAWGVPHLWLVDPKHRCLYVFGRHGLSEVDAWEIPEKNLRIALSDIFPPD
jgi:Uma2 family endonuclease